VVAGVGPSGLPADLNLPRTLVMGVLNVTSDSFSDGGRYLDPQAAIDHGLALAAAGADLVDVGGESTRPGAARVSAAAEAERVLPVVTALSAAGVAVSVDTMRADVAIAAVRSGAVLVNDVSGGLADPDMLAAMAEVSVPYIAMHWRGHSDEMDSHLDYDDVLEEVHDHLAQRLQAAVEAGVAVERVVLDPGLGFAKTAEHNWTLLAGLDRLGAIGRPLLIGASRKRFLGSLLSEGGSPRPVAERDAATAAISALAAATGIWGVRVHDVASSRDAVAVAQRWESG
jgi:dihydropteroate synthase